MMHYLIAINVVHQIVNKTYVISSTSYAKMTFPLNASIISSAFGCVNGSINDRDVVVSVVMSDWLVLLLGFLIGVILLFTLFLLGLVVNGCGSIMGSLSMELLLWVVVGVIIIGCCETALDVVDVLCCAVILSGDVSVLFVDICVCCADPAAADVKIWW